MRCCCYWESNEYRNNCFVSIKFALIKSYHLRRWNHRIFLWCGQLPQWNRHIIETTFGCGLRSQGWLQWNFHVNGTTFQSGLSSLRVLRKCALRHATKRKRWETFLINSKWVRMKLTRDQNGHFIVYTRQSIEKPKDLINWNNTIWKVKCSDFSEWGHCIAWERFKHKLHIESRTQRE